MITGVKNRTGAVSKDAIHSRFARHVSSGKVDFYAQAGIDFVLGRRDGIYVWDLDGHKLINLHSNGGVFNLGHRNKRITDALQQALSAVDIGNHHLVSEARAALAERLADLSPGDLNRVVFGVSGGEAVDMAIKLARGFTGRRNVISASGGYHGHTGLALSAGEEMYRAPFEPLAAGFSQVPFGDLDALEAVIDDSTAAVLFETIPATLGIVVPPREFYEGVRALCDGTGALMIMDEVQTGLGRCGATWGIDTFEVEPDIIVTGKGLSGGIYPITATIYHDRLNPFLHANPFIHISTFGGSELGCYVALEALNILEEPGFLPHVRKMASLFADGFTRLIHRYPGLLIQARQRGLMMGLKLADRRLGPLMSQIGFQTGLLIVYANHDPSVVQILPPLVIQAREVETVLDLLDRSLTEIMDIVQTGGIGNAPLNPEGEAS